MGTLEMGTRPPVWDVALGMRLLCWLAISLPAFFMLPAMDDWQTSLPVDHLRLAMFVPEMFWRPLETLHRWIAGRHPALYPFYPHLLSCLGHGLAGAQIHAIAVRLGARRSVAAIAAGGFLISPAIVAPLWSIDGANQTLSVALGLLATRVLLSRPTLPTALLSAGLILLGIAHKESAIAWVVIAPGMLLLANDSVFSGRRGLPRPPHALEHPRLMGIFALHALTGAGYLAFRGLVNVDTFVGGSGRYSLVLEPAHLLINALRLLGVSTTTTDTLALFGATPSRALAGLTLLASLPLLALLGKRFVRLSGWQSAGIAVTAVLASLAPHLPLAHVSEMYAYPTAAVLFLLAALYLPRRALSQGRWRSAIFLFAVAAVGVDFHKGQVMWTTGQSAREVAVRVATQLPDEGVRQLCVIEPIEKPEGSYSVFQAPAGMASGWGRSILLEERAPAELRSVHRETNCPVGWWRLEVSTHGEVDLSDPSTPTQWFPAAYW